MLSLRHRLVRISQLDSSLGYCEVTHYIASRPRDKLDQQGWLLVVVMVVDGYGLAFRFNRHISFCFFFFCLPYKTITGRRLSYFFYFHLVFPVSCFLIFFSLLFSCCIVIIVTLYVLNYVKKSRQNVSDFARRS